VLHEFSGLILDIDSNSHLTIDRAGSSKRAMAIDLLVDPEPISLRIWFINKVHSGAVHNTPSAPYISGDYSHIFICLFNPQIVYFCVIVI